MHFLNKFLYSLLAVFFEVYFYFTKDAKARYINESYFNDAIAKSYLNSSHFADKEFVRVVMKNKYIGPYKWFNTGGSSGNPLGFFLHVERRYVERVHQYFVWKFLLGWDNELIVTLDGSEGDSCRKSNFPYGKCRIGNYSIDRDINRLYVHIVHSKEGFYLRGYPSQCVALLRDLVNSNDFDTISRINGVYLTSESIRLEEIQWIFDYIPQNRFILQYGMSETAVFAIYDFDNECYRYSPFYSTVSFRKLDEGFEILGQFKNGKYNFGLYQTSDYVAKCETERVWKRSSLILGRTTEYVLNKANEKLELTGVVFGAHHRFFNLVVKWQIRNFVPGILEIHFSAQQESREIIESEIKQIFSNYDFQLEFLYDSDFMVSRNGKMHLVCH